MNTPTAPQAIFAFDAKGIQGFVFRTDKLKQMIGASELIAGLSDHVLTTALRHLGFVENTDWIRLRRSGGAVRLLFLAKNKADELAGIWPLIASCFAPGLHVVTTVVEITTGVLDALEATERDLRRKMQLLDADLPEAGPLGIRNRRSGLPATTAANEFADASTSRKLAATPDAQANLLRGLIGSSSPAAVPPRAGFSPGQIWPVEFDDIVANGESYLAVVHADGNGVGQFVIALIKQLRRKTEPEQIACYADFSEGLARASRGALAEALKPILRDWEDEKEACRRAHKPAPKIPLRPLICAGDDLTVVLRGSDALRFTSDYLRAFERTAGNLLSEDSLKGLSLSALKACAGIAYVHRQHPFARAYGVAESLAAFAKVETQRLHSALAFVRLTDTTPESFHQVLDEQLTLATGSRLTMNPYLVNTSGPGSHKSVRELMGLATLFSEIQKNRIPRGSFREVIGFLQQNSPDKAERAWLRAVEILKTKAAAYSRGKPDFEEFHRAMSKLTGGVGQAPALFSSETPPRTPLLDAIELAQLKTKPL